MSKNSTYIMPTYGDRNLEFKEGQGCHLTSLDNNKLGNPTSLVFNILEIIK